MAFCLNDLFYVLQFQLTVPTYRSFSLSLNQLDLIGRLVLFLAIVAGFCLKRIAHQVLPFSSCFHNIQALAIYLLFSPKRLSSTLVILPLLERLRDPQILKSISFQLAVHAH